MFLMVLLAIICGCFVATSQVVNSRLGVAIGHLQGSLWNHWVGGAYVFLLVAIVPGITHQSLPLDLPWFAYIAGLLGVVIVTLTNWIVPRLGAAFTIVLSISGQMITGTIVDFYHHKIQSLGFAILGVFLILLGVTLPGLFRSRRS